VVEKPLEVTVERCDAVINACDQNGAKLCTIFPSRFADSNLALKSAVDAGRFGRLTLGETTCKWWRAQEYYDKGGWRGAWKLGGGGAGRRFALGLQPADAGGRGGQEAVRAEGGGEWRVERPGGDLARRPREAVGRLRGGDPREPGALGGRPRRPQGGGDDLCD